MRKLCLLAGMLAVAVFALAASAAPGGTGVSGTPTVEPRLVDDASLKAVTTTVGGASVLPTTRTVAHWFGSTTDPHNGVTYGYNMVGSDPNHCSGAACSTTVEADITPLIVNIDGLKFDGSSVLDATLASPQFATNDYGTTAAATAAGHSQRARLHPWRGRRPVTG